MTGSESVFIRSSRRGGFTLIELLVVMGIIVIIAAVAMPAFRFITGSRSVDSGQNVVNAMIGRARTEAIVSGDNVGVFFFVDPRNDRSTLALVRQSANDAEYSGWSTNANANATGVTYNDATNPDIEPSSALQLVRTTDTREKIFLNPQPFQRLAAIPFQCGKTHQPTAASPNEVQSVSPYSNAPYWNQASGALEIVRDTEFQLLPQGVGAAVVVDPLSQQVWTSSYTGVGVDRYLRTGCVMFDGQGRFASLQFDVYSTSHLGKALMLDHTATSPLPGSTITLATGVTSGASATPSKLPPLFSGFGAVLFDRQALLADSKINGYSEGDYLFSVNQTMPQPPYGLAYNTDATAEGKKQLWLDTNGLLLTATRYNGAMTKGE